MNMLMLFLPMAIVVSQYVFAKPAPCELTQNCGW